MKQLYVFCFFTLCFISINSIAKTRGQVKLDSLLKALKNEKQDTTVINYLNNIAEDFLDSDSDTSIYFAGQALALGEKLNYNNGKGRAFLSMGFALSDLGEYDKARNKFLEAIDAFKMNRDLKNLSKTYNGLGILNRSVGNYEESLKNYFLALKIRKEINDTNSIAGSYNNIANIYSDQGKYVEAVRNYFEALKIFEKIGNKKNVAYINNNIAEIYRLQENYPEALKRNFETLSLAAKLDDPSLTSGSYNNIGNIYRELNNYPQALKYYLAALKIANKLASKPKIALYQRNIGNVYYDQNNYPVALDNYYPALKINIEIENKQGEGVCYNMIGNCLLRQNKFTKSKDYFLKSINIAKQIGDKVSVKEGYSNLEEIESMQGNFREAYKNLKMYIIYRDSLLNEENTKKTVQTQMQYDFDKKEAVTKAKQDKKEAFQLAEVQKQKLVSYSIIGGAVIILLALILIFFFYKRRRDAEQKQKETLLSLQVSETEMKALRSQMNPHFIFNALQSIQTFLISNKSDDANLYLLKFSKLMRAVLENSQHSEVPLKEDMQALELYMQLESIRLTHPFTYQFNIDASVDTERDCLPPLILQPFVENAIWHGLQYKESSGHIDIFISKKNNALFATVEDNGVGRNRSKQVDQPMLLKKESLGMKLTEERLKILNEVKKIKAKFQIIDLFTPDNMPAGTRVEFSLPMAS